MTYKYISKKEKPVVRLEIDTSKLESLNFRHPWIKNSNVNTFDDK